MFKFNVITKKTHKDLYNSNIIKLLSLSHIHTHTDKYYINCIINVNKIRSENNGLKKSNIFDLKIF